MTGSRSGWPVVNGLGAGMAKILPQSGLVQGYGGLCLLAWRGRGGAAWFLHGGGPFLGGVWLVQLHAPQPPWTNTEGELHNLFVHAVARSLGRTLHGFPVHKEYTTWPTRPAPFWLDLLGGIKMVPVSSPPANASPGRDYTTQMQTKTSHNWHQQYIIFKKNMHKELRCKTVSPWWNIKKKS